MKSVELRGDEVIKIYQSIAHSAPIYPLELIVTEAPLIVFKQ